MRHCDVFGAAFPICVKPHEEKDADRVAVVDTWEPETRTTPATSPKPQPGPSGSPGTRGCRRRPRRSPSSASWRYAAEHRRTDRLPQRRMQSSMSAHSSCVHMQIRVRLEGAEGDIPTRPPRGQASATQPEPPRWSSAPRPHPSRRCSRQLTVVRSRASSVYTVWGSGPRVRWTCLTASSAASACRQSTAYTGWSAAPRRLMCGGRGLHGSAMPSTPCR